VLVDVVVTDKQGKPVSGLKAEDFTIEEKGKKQKIAVFQTPEEAQQQNTPPHLDLVSTRIGRSSALRAGR